MTNILEFPPAKDPLAFDGMGIKIDVRAQRESFDTLFTNVQTALRFCNLNHVEAKEMVRNLLVDEDGGFIDEMGSQWAESVGYLEAIVKTMKAALIRLGVSEDCVLGRTRSRS